MSFQKILSPSERTIAIVIGLGVVLFPVHSRNLTFGIGEETYFFLPWVGFGLILYGLICLFDNKWAEFKVHLGPKVLYIPLLVIVGSAFARFFVDPSAETVAGAGLLTGFFVLYVAARKLGTRILWAFAPIIIIEAVSCILQGLIDPGYRAGGVLTSFRNAEYTPNYDIAAGWLILGSCIILGMNRGLKLWWLALIAVALYFVAAEEALFAIVGLSVFAFIRRDVSKAVLIIVLLLGVVVAIGSFTGLTGDLYKNTYDKVQAAADDNDPNRWDNTTTGRVTVLKEAVTNIAPLGHGLNLTGFTTHTPHNGLIIVLDQLGVLAALAWLWIVVYCFVKTSWKYCWAAFILLGVWDHFVWSQFAPFFWVLVGLSSTVLIDDRLFRRKEVCYAKESSKETAKNKEVFVLRKAH